MSWTFVVLALVLFIFAIYIGFLCGQWACEKRVITKRDYWIANFAGAAAVVLLTWVFSLFPLVQFAPIGWLGGFIAGLKMSFGESVGPWRKHDEVFNVNKAHRAAADAGDAEERRRARHNGAADRQLISVTDDSKGAGKHSSPTRSWHSSSWQRRTRTPSTVWSRSSAAPHAASASLPPACCICWPSATRSASCPACPR